MDSIHDQQATAGKIRVLTVVDTISRFSPVLDPRLSYCGEDVVQTLEATSAAVGYPKTIRVDQGSEFICRDLDLWTYTNGVTQDFSRPGKPTDNAYIEAFNGCFRAECLNTYWFLRLADAREKLEESRRHYNVDRPHGAIGNKPPITLVNPGEATGPSPRPLPGSSNPGRSREWCRIRRSRTLPLNGNHRGSTSNTTRLQCWAGAAVARDTGAASESRASDNQNWAQALAATLYGSLARHDRHARTSLRRRSLTEE